MTDQREDEWLRDALRIAAGSPDNEMRARVLQELEQVPTRRGNRTRWWGLSAAAILLVGGLAGVFAIVRASGDDSIRRTALPTSDATASDGVVDSATGPVEFGAELLVSDGPREIDPDRRMLSSAGLRPGVSMVTELDSDFVVIEDVVDEFTIGIGSESEDVSAPRMRILAPPAVTADEIERSLSGEHFDTEVLGVGDGEIGNVLSRVVDLASAQGTSIVGFEVGPGVSISASGIDRRYQAHIVMADGRPLVVWIDAPMAEFDQFQRRADALLETLMVHP